MVVIIDYNIGNLSSVISALKRVGIDAIISRDKKISWNTNFRNMFRDANFI